MVCGEIFFTLRSSPWRCIIIYILYFFITLAVEELRFFYNNLYIVCIFNLLLANKILKEYIEYQPKTCLRNWIPIPSTSFPYFPFAQEPQPGSTWAIRPSGTTVRAKSPIATANQRAPVAIHHVMRSLRFENADCFILFVLEYFLFTFCGNVMWILS